MVNSRANESLKKENEKLKNELEILKQEFNEWKAKMEKSTEASPSDQDIQFISDSCADLEISKENTIAKLNSIDQRLNSLTADVQRLGRAIDEALEYSYKYNIKIVGVPEKPNESAEETAQLCLNIFKAIGANTTYNDIDIAHRIPTKSKTTYNPIICKFTRRLAISDIFKQKKNLKDLTPRSLDVQSSSPLKIMIFNHLTPKMQDIFRLAKEHKTKYEYKYCWARDSGVFLRKADDTKVIKINSYLCLNRLLRSDEGESTAMSFDGQ